MGSYGRGSWAVRHSATVDLYNATIRGGRVYVSNLSPESEKVLKAVAWQLASGYVGAQAHVPSVDIRRGNFHCDAEKTRHVYFVSPWQWSNAWHFLNDATALTHQLLTTPGYDAVSGTFQDGKMPSLAVFWPPISGEKKKARPMISVAEVALKALFGENIYGAEALGSNCWHVHWGSGARVVGPVDGGGFVDERRAAAETLRQRILKSQCPLAEKKKAVNKPIIRALFVRRKKGASRAFSPQATNILGRLFYERHNVEMRLCCDWENACAVVRAFAEADIVIGMHGAGLANSLFAPLNFVLVELHSAYGSDLDLFRKLAQARQGGYVSVTAAVAGDGAFLDLPNATNVVDCAVALWRRGSAAISFAQVRDACGSLGPEANDDDDSSSSSSKNTTTQTKNIYPLGTIAKLNNNKVIGLDGAAPVGHDVDCVSPRANVYTCPEAVGLRPCCATTTTTPCAIVSYSPSSVNNNINNKKKKKPPPFRGPILPCQAIDDSQ